MTPVRVHTRLICAHGYQMGEISDPVGTESLTEGVFTARRSGEHAVLHH